MFDAPSLKFLALVVSAYVCALFTLLAPRPVSEVAGWALPVSVGAPQRACSQVAPLSGPAAELRDTLREHNRAQLGLAEATTVLDERARRFRTLYKQAGKAGISAVKLTMLCDLARALEGVLPSVERASVLGRFLDELARERVIDGAGRLRLPIALVEVLYTIHMNIAIGIPLLEDLTREERLVYFGALALHLPGATASRKQWAAQAYADEGGPHALDVLAQAALQTGDTERAVSLLRGVFAQTGELRARNRAYWLAL